MIGALLVFIIILASCCAYLYIKIRNLKLDKLKLEDEKISDNDLKFIEFTVEMYIKYSKEFGIHSEQQHEYIVKELERIRTKYLTKQIDNERQ